MKYYTVNGLSASGTANKTAANIIGSTAIRPRLRSIKFGFNTAPNATDQFVQVQVGNTTAAGTAGSSPTPKPRDPQDVAAVCTAGITHSAEPTYGSTFFEDFALNQRAFYHLQYEPEQGPCGAATASNGVGVKLTAVTAAMVMSAVVEFTE